LHGSVNIINIETGSHNPAPGLIQFYIGELGHWFAVGSLGPGVFNKTAPFLFADRHHLHKQCLAVGVFAVAQILAVQFRLQGVHHHLRAKVIDPDIVATVFIADAADPVGCLLLGIFLGQGAIINLFLKRNQHTGGLLDKICSSILLLSHDQSADIRYQHQEGCQNQQQPGGNGQPHNLPENPPVTIALHTLSPL